MMNKKLRSLTLIELIITITIVSVIAVSLFAAFQTGLASFKKVEAGTDVYQTARIVFDRIDRDLKNSYAYLKEDSRFNGQSHALGFFSVSTIYGSAGPSAVSCRLMYGRDNRHLVRSCVMGGETSAMMERSAPSVIAGNIKEISFQYAHATGDSGNEYEWIDAWPSDDTQKAQFPLAVRVTLVLFEGEKSAADTVEFSSVCSLPQ